MPWARIAPNLAMTSSCLSLMTLEYSCLNWFTWKSKKKNYGLTLSICDIKKHPISCLRYWDWSLNFKTFRRWRWTRCEGRTILCLKSVFRLLSVGAWAVFSPHSTVDDSDSRECWIRFHSAPGSQQAQTVQANTKAFVALWITVMLLTVNRADLLTGTAVRFYLM